MAARYTLSIHTPCELRFASYPLSGLFELAAQGHVRLALHQEACVRAAVAVYDDPAFYAHQFGFARAQLPRWRANLKAFVTSRYTLHDAETGQTRHFAIDLKDQHYIFPSDDLAACDVVFKRHLRPDSMALLPPEQQGKLHPFGLRYDVRSEHAPPDLLEQLFQVVHAGGPGRERKSPAYHRERWYAMRTIAQFEAPSVAPSQPFVLYQTRVLANANLDALEVYAERAQLIRKLRAALGPRFRGGFVPDQAAGRYPDCLTDVPTEPVAYTNFVRTAPIVVYTRGLWQSPARKLGEYLAAGKCIVAERYDGLLPEALQHDHDILFFDTQDECLALCAALLNDPQRVQRIAANAADYYRRQVHPAASMWHVMQAALA